MLLDRADFNGAEQVLRGELAAEWQELEEVLSELALHLKASDQDGIQGSPVFNPKGTNAAIKSSLAEARGWTPNPPIPDAFSFLGTDVDFARNGLLVESQFSNYPFFLNNLLRSELFYRNAVEISGCAIRALIMITKDRMFPASNSTLYYQQGVEQTRNLTKFDLISIPVRVVGLKVPPDVPMGAVYSEYRAARYARAVVRSTPITVTLASPRSANGRHRFVL